MKTQKFNVTGMTCAACQANVTRRVQKLEGVKDVDVNLLSGRMTVEYDESALTAPVICAAVQEIGYGASDAEAPSQGAQAQAASGFREEWQSRQQRAEDDQASMKRRLISSIILLIPLMYVAMGGMMGLPMPGFPHRHGKRPHLGADAAGHHRAGHPHQPQVLHRRLQGARPPRAEHGFSGGGRLQRLAALWHLRHVPHGLRLWPRRHGRGTRIRPRPLL